MLVDSVVWVRTSCSLIVASQLTASSVIEQFFKDLLFNPALKAFPVRSMKAWRAIEV
jgi:hypothetical protein